MLAFNRPTEPIYVNCEVGCATDSAEGIALDRRDRNGYDPEEDPFAIRKMPDQTIPHNYKYKKECNAKDPANCPYHGTGKYAKAPMDLTHLQAYVDAIFTENHFPVPKVTLKVTDAKKGRVYVELPFTTARDKWTKFNFLKANFGRNSKGISQQDLFAFDRTSHTMSCNIKVRNFVTASEGEKGIETADKGKKGTVKKTAAAKPAQKRTAAPAKPTKPQKGAAQPPARKPPAKPAPKSARRNAAQTKPKPGSARAKVATALQRAKARKVFNRVKALRASRAAKGKPKK